MANYHKEFTGHLKSQSLDLIDTDSIGGAPPGLETESFSLSDIQICRVFKRDIYQEIIGCNAFRRLKNIRFLGAIDYAFFPDKSLKRHSRYQHSLGVARLALEYAKLMQLSETQEILCVTAALLHDIGHPPLSHSLESVFVNEFKIGHHAAGETIIKGDLSIGNSLWKILDKHDLNLFEVMSIIEGLGPEPCFTHIFSHPINIDTIEGILRSESYFSDKYSSTITPDQVLTALVKLIQGDKSGVEILDSFWRKKHKIYSILINSRFGVMADLICQQYMNENIDKFEKGCFYKTEKDLQKDHKALFSDLEKLKDEGELVKRINKHNPDYIKREFYIENIEIDSVQKLDSRYKQRKIIQKNQKKDFVHAGEFSEHSSSFSLF